ncbi:ATP-dependent DNA helicase [Trichonephila clavipes]|nr:ATP-dependent DNA helicase [Trichonephila clavipes]
MDLEFSTKIFNEAFIIIEDKVRSSGRSYLKSIGLPQPNQDSNTFDDVIRERTYNKITESVFEETGGIFLFDAPGSTGKTFLLNLILAEVQESGEIALAVNSSGIAATLLTGRRATHSNVKLPLHMTVIETLTCNISRRSEIAKVLKCCILIIWDQCTMSHKTAFEALDVPLQDLRSTILTGQAAGKDVFIPKTPIIPSDDPFQSKQSQFLIRLSFAMSINKV